MNTVASTEAPVVYTGATTDGDTVTLELAQTPIKARFGVGNESDFLALTCHIIDMNERWPGLIVMDANKKTVEVSWSDGTDNRVVTLDMPDKPTL